MGELPDGLMSLVMGRRSKPVSELQLTNSHILVPVAGLLVGRRWLSPEGGRYGREHLILPHQSGSLQRHGSPPHRPMIMVARGLGSSCLCVPFAILFRLKPRTLFFRSASSCVSHVYPENFSLDSPDQ